MDVHDMNSGWGWAMMFLLTLTVLVTIGLIAWLASSGRSSTTAESTAPRPTARQILDERLARGEIDIDEYNRRVAALQSGSGSR